MEVVKNETGDVSVTGYGSRDEEMEDICHRIARIREGEKNASVAVLFYDGLDFCFESAVFLIGFGGEHCPDFFLRLGLCRSFFLCGLRLFLL